MKDTGVLTDRQVSNRELARDVVTATLAAIPFLDQVPRKDAARWCYYYIRDHIAYIAEMETQDIRLPWRTIQDGRADCKSQSVFVASVCARAGCRVSLRFAAMPGQDWLGHVYAVVDGVVIDPLLPLGDECPYQMAITVPIEAVNGGAH